MPPAVFEPIIPASEPQQTHALDRTATGICGIYIYIYIFSEIRNFGNMVLFEGDKRNTEKWSTNL